MCFSATLEGSVAHLVKDYMRNPVRLAFGSTLKPSENVRLQAYEVSRRRQSRKCCAACSPRKAADAWYSRAPSAEPSGSPEA